MPGGTRKRLANAELEAMTPGEKTFADLKIQSEFADCTDSSLRRLSASSFRPPVSALKYCATVFAELH